MNKIILLILFNFLIYYLCKTNIYLAISIFLFMIYYIIRLRYNITNNIIEGQSYETYEEIDYKNNFINSLNDDIIKNRESKFYLDIVFDKLNMFLKKYISKENIPVDQPCIGIFDSWSDCSVDCGTGSQYRKYSILQNSGEGGIKCIFKDGQIDKKTCYKGLCNYNASCVEDNDCNTGYCNPYTKLCDDREKCTIYALYNCEPDECDKLGENYHIDELGNCIDYSQREYNPDFSPGTTPIPGSTPGLTPPTPGPTPGPSPPAPPPPTPPSPPPAPPPPTPPTPPTQRQHQDPPRHQLKNHAQSLSSTKSTFHHLPRPLPLMSFQRRGRRPTLLFFSISTTFLLVRSFQTLDVTIGSSS